MRIGAGEPSQTAPPATPEDSLVKEPQGDGAPAVDVLFDGQHVHVLESKRVHTQNTHGTGMHATRQASHALNPLHAMCMASHDTARACKHPSLKMQDARHRGLADMC